MKKIVIIMTALLFCHSVFATSQYDLEKIGAQAIQFDPVSNSWPLTFNPIPEMNRVYQIKTVGNYAFAFDYANNTVSFHNGKNWQLPLLHLQNIPIYGIPVVIPKYLDSNQNPDSWITILGRDSSTNIFYFNGVSLSLPLPLPFPLDAKNPSFLESHHMLWIIDYKTNRVFWTANTSWNMASSLPNGKLIAITTDKLNDDLYALELDTSNNQYFVTHLLANNQWEKPLYINFFAPNATLTDLMVMNGGKTISLFLNTNTSKHVFISQDMGKNFIDTGNIPYSNQIDPSFISLYNGNKGNILWSIFSQNAPEKYVDTIAYLDQNSNTTWIKIKIPTKPLALVNFNSVFYYKTISDDGTQFWINGLDEDKKKHVIYYDIKQGFIDPRLSETISVDELQAMNHGQAFGLGLTTAQVVNLFYDGQTWHVNPIAKIFPGGLSYGYRNDWRVTAKQHTKDRTFVDSTTKNIWIYQ